MPQGWAGAQTGAGRDLRCAFCLKDGKGIYAETIIDGTAVCEFHVHWIEVGVRKAPGEPAVIA